MPGGFLFSLINKSDHDVQLPTPGVACEDSFDGSIEVSVEFHPLHAGDKMEDGGCADDRGGEWPSIMTRLKSWKTLRPGEAMMPKGARDVFHYSDTKPGTYKFWATFTPPVIEEIDQQLLAGSGVDFPIKDLVSSPLTFEKKL